MSDLPTHQEILGRIIVGQDLPLRPFLVNPGGQETVCLGGETIVGDQLADPVLEERLAHQCHRRSCEEEQIFCLRLISLPGTLDAK